MYKFRSMIVNDQSDTAWSTNEDPRKTKFGAFIRKYSIDELPQLYNVLKGDMSLVGPRPELPYFVENFQKSVPLYMVKHQVKPGITGLAQVKGYLGDTSIPKRIEWDVYYIENWSLFFGCQNLIDDSFQGLEKRGSSTWQRRKGEGEIAVEKGFIWERKKKKLVVFSVALLLAVMPFVIRATQHFLSGDLYRLFLVNRKTEIFSQYRARFLWIMAAVMLVLLLVCCKKLFAGIDRLGWFYFAACGVFLLCLVLSTLFPIIGTRPCGECMTGQRGWSHRFAI